MRPNFFGGEAGCLKSRGPSPHLLDPVVSCFSPSSFPMIIRKFRYDRASIWRTLVKRISQQLPEFEDGGEGITVVDPLGRNAFAVREFTKHLPKAIFVYPRFGWKRDTIKAQRLLLSDKSASELVSEFNDKLDGRKTIFVLDGSYEAIDPILVDSVMSKRSAILIGTDRDAYINRFVVKGFANHFHCHTRAMRWQKKHGEENFTAFFIYRIDNRSKIHLAEPLDLDKVPVP